MRKSLTDLIIRCILTAIPLGAIGGMTLGVVGMCIGVLFAVTICVILFTGPPH